MNPLNVVYQVYGVQSQNGTLRSRTVSNVENVLEISIDFSFESTEVYKYGAASFVASVEFKALQSQNQNEPSNTKQCSKNAKNKSNNFNFKWIFVN